MLKNKVFEFGFIFYDDKTVELTGDLVPTDPSTILSIMSNCLKIMNDFSMRQNQKEQSNIIIPKLGVMRNDH